MVRRTQALGGFAAVLARGERDSGTILVVLVQGGAGARLYERMPDLDGNRRWHCSRREDSDPQAFAEYLERRRRQDPDAWLVELDVANGEQVIGAGDDKT